MAILELSSAKRMLSHFSYDGLKGVLKTISRCHAFGVVPTVKCAAHARSKIGYTAPWLPITVDVIYMRTLSSGATKGMHITTFIRAS